MSTDHDVAAIMGGLYGDGIIGLKGAFTPDWADRLYGEIIPVPESRIRVIQDGERLLLGGASSLRGFRTGSFDGEVCRAGADFADGVDDGLAVFDAGADVARRDPAVDALLFQISDDAERHVAIGAGVTDEDIRHRQSRR